MQQDYMVSAVSLDTFFLWESVYSLWPFVVILLISVMLIAYGLRKRLLLIMALLPCLVLIAIIMLNSKQDIISGLVKFSCSIL